MKDARQHPRILHGPYKLQPILFEWPPHLPRFRMQGWVKCELQIVCYFCGGDKIAAKYWRIRWLATETLGGYFWLTTKMCSKVAFKRKTFPSLKERQPKVVAFTKAHPSILNRRLLRLSSAEFIRKIRRKLRRSFQPPLKPSSPAPWPPTIQTV